MPPKRRRGAPGLLGLRHDASSDDEDYRPPGGVHSADRATTAARRQAAAEEDLPLAQRRRQLQQQQQQQRASGSGSGGGGAAPSPAAAAAVAAASAAGAAAAAALGPAPHLPEEVLVNILRLACAPAAGGAVPTAAVAACVSRSWRAAVAAYPEVWQHMELGRGRRCRPTDAAVARCAPRWSHLRWLSLTGATALGDAGVTALAEACPRLASLTMAHCAQFSAAAVASALRAMLLRPAAADGSSAPLTRLDLSFTQFAPKTSGLDQVVREVLTAQAQNPGGPVLQELVVEGCPLLTHQPLRAAVEASAEQKRPLLGALRVLDMTQSAGARSDFALNIERLQYAAPRLQQLRLNGLCGAYAWSFNGAPATLPPGAPPPAFPELTVCQVAAKSQPNMAGLGTGATNVTNDCLTRLLAHSSSLYELDVSGCERLTPDALATAVHPAAPLRHALLARSGACCDEAVSFLVDRFGATLEAVDLSWGAARISDEAAAALARCPRLHSVGLAGTAVTGEGLRQLLLAFDAHAAAAAAAAGAGGEGASSSNGGGSGSSSSPAEMHLDVSSCRGLDRAARQAATAGTAQLRKALGVR